MAQSKLALPLAEMRGPWVTNRQNYDGAMCKTHGWVRVNSRYYDMIAYGLKVENKKIKIGCSTFVNLVVYAEMKVNPELAQSITNFMIYTGDRIIEYYIVDTAKLVDYLIPNTELAELILLEHKLFHGKNRNQYSITIKEIKKLAGV